MISSIPYLRATAALALALALDASAFASEQADSSTPYYFSTLAGDSARGFVDGPGSTARFYRPAGIAIDSEGNAYVTDAGNNTIRKITRAGIVSTLAGSPGTRGNTDGLGSAARFDTPWAITIDLGGNLFVEDVGNGAIRKVTPQGEVTTAVRKTEATISDIDLYLAAGRISPATANVPPPIFNGRRYHPFKKNYENVGLDTYFGSLPPPSLAADSAGNAYSIYDGAVKKTGTSAPPSTLAGSERQYGSIDGVGSAARFSYTLTPATDLVGNVYVADLEAGTIRKITPAGEVTTVAGTSDFVDVFAPDRDSSSEHLDRARDGDRADARFGRPSALAVAPSGDILVADGSAVRRVTATGTVRTFAGRDFDNDIGSVDGTGASARFGAATDCTIAPDGCLYVSDSNDAIRKVTPAGVVTTLAGYLGQPGSADGSGSGARFFSPGGITVDRNGNLYVSDTGNHTIRKVTPAGVVTTVAGLPGTAGDTDGPAASATFDYPEEIAVDRTGNIFVQCWGSHVALRMITPEGIVSTLRTGYDGYAAPLATDPAGNVYAALDRTTIVRLHSDGSTTAVLDISNWPEFRSNRASAHDVVGPFTVSANGDIYLTSPWGIVRKITNEGRSSYLAGIWRFADDSSWPSEALADGLGTAVRFVSQNAIAVDPTGTLYVADGCTIRKGQLAGPVTISTQPQSQSATVGTAVQFSVTATGVPAPSYQWRFNGTPISGATAATLSLTSVSAANAGDYTVVATNDLGSATSSAATLTVTAAPVTPTTPSAPSSGGGGALGACFALVLLALGAARQHAMQARWASQR